LYLKRYICDDVLIKDLTGFEVQAQESIITLHYPGRKCCIFYNYFEIKLTEEKKTLSHWLVFTPTSGFILLYAYFSSVFALFHGTWLPPTAHRSKKQLMAI
jgi:hypothetical protein